MVRSELHEAVYECGGQRNQWPGLGEGL
jgi:hypothetical protein